MAATPVIAARGAIALIAHDQMKETMVDFARDHRSRLATFDLYATGTTGSRILEACPELVIVRVKSGPLGGDQQIGSLISEGRISGLFFLIDPLSPLPHDVDVKALTRLGVLYNIAMALNRRTADVLIAHPETLEFDTR